jgi:hypothetical protein
MHKTLMVSVAVAALLVSPGLATAQGVNQGAEGISDCRFAER